MSAPLHDPLVVNTQDGCCWTRRAVNREGRGLYALADVQGPVPELVLATLRELAEHGLSSMAFALPMPVGGVPQLSEVEQLRARVAELEAERHSTNEALDDAARALREQRDRIAFLEALKPAAVQTCRKCGAGYTYGEPCSTCAFRARMAAETQPLRGRPLLDAVTVERAEQAHWQRLGVEDPHDLPLHHDYRVGRDLPGLGGQQ